MKFLKNTTYCCSKYRKMATNHCLTGKHSAGAIYETDGENTMTDPTAKPVTPELLWEFMRTRCANGKLELITDADLSQYRFL